MAELATIDPGNAHVVPYMWGATGLGTDEDRVRQALRPGAALDGWGLLFDPANAAKLSACGLGIVDNAEDTFPAALFWKGMPPRISASRRTPRRGTRSPRSAPACASSATTTS